MRLPFALLAMLGFVLSAVLGPLRTTQAGVQCPTAPVQTVVTRDCCGRLVVRSPKPGEKAFKQCRCEEKKQSASRADASPRNEALPSVPPTLEIPLLPALRQIAYRYLAVEALWSSPPVVRPPALS